MLWFDALARTRGEAAVEPVKSVGYDEWAGIAATVAAPADADDPHALLTPADVATLAAIERIEIGAHTANHPILASANLAVQRRELLEYSRWCLIAAQQSSQPGETPAAAPSAATPSDPPPATLRPRPPARPLLDVPVA